MKKKGERKDAKPAPPARGPGGRFVKKSASDGIKPAASGKETGKTGIKSAISGKSGGPQTQADLRAAGRINAGLVSKTGQQPPADPGATAQDSGGHDPSRPIGPGNPPRAGQIKPGEVRNPAGYPKGRPQTKTVIKYWLGLEETIKNPLDPSELIRVSVLDSMTLALIARARKGEVAAFRELLDRIEGKPVQSTKLLNADDKLLEISVGFAAPQKPQTPNE